jgi:hypothetical protein
MSNASEQFDAYIAIREFADSMFLALEDVSLRNKAYSEVVRTEPNQADLAARVQAAEDSLRNLAEPLKYSDLRDQTIHALEARSLDELPRLGREVQERVQTWGKP